jgi:hypothetical protein
MSETTISIWTCHKLTNLALSELGVNKELPPQMFYNYTKSRLNKNLKPLIPCVMGEDGKVSVEKEDFEKWLAKYLEKNVIRRIANV